MVSSKRKIGRAAPIIWAQKALWPPHGGDPIVLFNDRMVTNCRIQLEQGYCTRKMRFVKGKMQIGSTAQRGAAEKAFYQYLAVLTLTPGPMVEAMTQERIY